MSEEKGKKPFKIHFPGIIVIGFFFFLVDGIRTVGGVKHVSGSPMTKTCIHINTTPYLYPLWHFLFNLLPFPTPHPPPPSPLTTHRRPYCVYAAGGTAARNSRRVTPRKT